ncbi:MAG: hypothetical protein LDL31_09415 [Prosthecobacter sp.]|jgi:hypothetical protein|nr:hypothetical protein [Prosthecobacter sp.]
MNAKTAGPWVTLTLVLVSVLIASCSSSDEPKRRERQPPPVADSTLPWNRPTKWEGTGRYGQMMPMSR